jgi:hypothetical protein
MVEWTSSIRRALGFLAVIAAVTPGCGQNRSKGAPMLSSGSAGHQQANGVSLYYEVHGTRRPLLLLHGGVGASEMFGPNVEVFAKGRQVIAVHLQGHGKTPDVDRPLRFETMGDTSRH